MSGELSVESTGETVGEAKWAALRELERRHPGLDKAAVRFQVVSEGERGLLGVGYSPARVVATVDAGAAAAAAPPPREAHPDESADAALVRELVERVADEIGARCDVEIEEADDELVAVCEGPDLGLLIGRHGQTIDALQYLANAMVQRRRQGEERRSVVVDAAGYRSRRTATLEALAQRTAERVSATGGAVELDPMTAVERKIVHEYLKEDPEVETTSEGTEPNRYVVILPRRSLD
jgi:spoIIIJ-associated protein